jgi:hypothetical protein
MVCGKGKIAVSSRECGRTSRSRPPMAASTPIAPLKIQKGSGQVVLHLNYRLLSTRHTQILRPTRERSSQPDLIAPAAPAINHYHAVHWIRQRKRRLEIGSQEMTMKRSRIGSQTLWSVFVTSPFLNSPMSDRTRPQLQAPPLSSPKKCGPGAQSL